MLPVVGPGEEQGGPGTSLLCYLHLWVLLKQPADSRLGNSRLSSFFFFFLIKPCEEPLSQRELVVASVQPSPAHAACRGASSRAPGNCHVVISPEPPVLSP